jgi:hypothetical protein
VVSLLRGREYWAVLLPHCRFDLRLETSRFVTGAAT